MANDVLEEAAAWPPDPDAVEVETWQHRGNDAITRMALIRHPTASFSRPVPFEFDAIKDAALDYLMLVKTKLGVPLPDEWLQALQPGVRDPKFHWLPLEQDLGRKPPAFGSFRVDNLAGDRPVDQTLVLLAGELLETATPAGSEVGLRIVVNSLPNGGGIRITGMSAALPSKPGASVLALLEPRNLVDMFEAIRNDLSASAALQRSSLTVRGIRLADEEGEAPAVELRARALSVVREGEAPQPYEILFKMSSDLKRIDVLNRVLLSSCSGAMMAVSDFPVDPASHEEPKKWRLRRPTRDEALLAADLEADQVPKTLAISGQFEIRQSFLVPGDHPFNVKTVSLASQPKIRSNDFTAISTFHNLRELFGRFGLYGIPLETYFRHAALPVFADYRSGVRPGPGKDGQTVNGRVTPLDWTAPETALYAPSAEKPGLVMQLALAELPVRDRQPWDHKSPAYAEPFGFAADPRWIWHEAAHVLIMASLGELEFRFAHSMGDGLAAIVEDPVSRLANDPRWRGATYPFVFAPRRHDRCVCDGWGWAGRIGRPLRHAPTQNRLNPKGYLTEQILSTSLFRMYRCLGGDTLDPALAPAPGARGDASDYAVYLIMEAVRLLGDPRVVPASHAEQFAASLIDADVRTTKCPTSSGAGRVGGTSHKAIRWAFEAQGMYAGKHNESAPGRPPLVDVFIADDRVLTELFPATEVTYDAGSYAPVSLDWAGLADGALGGKPPAWFATEAMKASGGVLSVRVGNRGRHTAIGVAVRLWWLSWAADMPPPVWDRALWTAGASVSLGDIAPQDSVTEVGLPLPPGPVRHLIMAEAFCLADRANLDPASLLAPSIAPVPLEHLVPQDNNLGLIAV